MVGFIERESYAVYEDILPIHGLLPMLEYLIGIRQKQNPTSLSEKRGLFIS